MVLSGTQQLFFPSEDKIFTAVVVDLMVDWMVDLMVLAAVDSMVVDSP